MMTSVDDALLDAMRSEDGAPVALNDYRATVRCCFDADSFSRLLHCQARGGARPIWRSLG